MHWAQEHEGQNINQESKTAKIMNLPCICPSLSTQTDAGFHMALDPLYYLSLPVRRGEHKDGEREREKWK